MAIKHALEAHKWDATNSADEQKILTIFQARPPDYIGEQKVRRAKDF